MAKILVVAEQAAGQLKKSTLATLTLAKELEAKVGGGIDFLVVGSGISGVVDALQGFGAQTIYTADAAAFENYLAQPYTAAVKAAVAASGADFVVAPAGTFGKDLLPRVAAALSAGMIADVVALGATSELSFKRPMYAGNVIATVKANTAKVVISVRASEFDVAASVGGSSAVQALSVDVGKVGARFVGVELTESERPALSDADVVISGGRGLKDGETFWATLNPLADVLGAAIGATRAVVDSWPEVPNDMQVGQTGQVVAPKLYIAVAISGAIQHLAGMKNSKTIVAINKDGDAPIYSIADYGLVGDAFKILPELTEKIKAAKA